MRDASSGVISALPKRKCWDFSAALSASCFSFCFLGTDCSTLDFFGGERVAVRSFSSSNFSFGCFSLMLLRLRNFGKAGRKDAVEFKVFREVVNKGQDHVAEEQQPFTLTGVSDVGKLMGEMFSCFAKICRSPFA